MKQCPESVVVSRGELAAACLRYRLGSHRDINSSHFFSIQYRCSVGEEVVPEQPAGHRSSGTQSHPVTQTLNMHVNDEMI
ncbi:hypothetical protein Bpfe_023995 [Biomphalaria pfeifferi]|uniref:Uncharacterized protein n=1 Tax=Biomphalaria pfeifferi TaxID=112525 RepID=A0AAD8B1Z1_BIOPF|nr:hypothetical protein Bpfe_023995 [Biomphalaria pfeifferi]